MSGGIINLVANTDYLSNNYQPQITFFRRIYRRHTNISPQYIDDAAENNQILNDQISNNQNINDQTIIDKKIITLIEKVMYNSVLHRNTDCAICITDYNIDSHVYVTECNHVYHYDCFTEFIKIKNFPNRCACPLCRALISLQYNQHD